VLNLSEEVRGTFSGVVSRVDQIEGECSAFGGVDVITKMLVRDGRDLDRGCDES
jgi:hypothetical protein